MVKHLRRRPPSKVDLDENEWKSKQVHPSRDQTESQEDPSIQITRVRYYTSTFSWGLKSPLHFVSFYVRSQSIIVTFLAQFGKCAWFFDSGKRKERKENFVEKVIEK